MQRSVHALSAAIIAATSLLAQNVVVPAAAATADVSSSQNIWREVALRYMSIYDSTNFTTQNVGEPIVINTIEWRMAGGQVGVAASYPSVEIYIEPAAVDYAAMSTTYQTNRTLARPRTPEYSGPVTLNVGAGTTPNSYSVTISLQNPITYTPDAGQDLLVEIVVLAAPTPAAISTISSSNSVAGQKCQSVRTVGNTVNLTGTLSAFSPVVRLGYTPDPNGASSKTYGVGCYTKSRTFYEQFAGSANDLGGKTVSLAMSGGAYSGSTAPGASVVAPVSPALTLGDDVVSTAIALPFTFDYPGGSTTQVFVDSNGSVLLSGTAASSIGGSAAAFVASTVARLSPSMQDLDPSVVGGVFAEADPANPTSVFLITWQGVPCFNTVSSGLTSTFQVALIDNGSNDSVEFRYGTLTNDSSSNGGVAVTGFTTGVGAIDVGGVDLTAGPFSASAVDQLALALSVAPRPILGSSINFTTSNIPLSGISLVLISAGQLLPGFDLGIIGMPGCNANIVLPEFQSFLNIGGPSFVMPASVPNDPLLLGVSVYAQAGALDPTANAFGAVASNGVALKIGSL